MLYKRDYTQLTPEEQQRWDEVEEMFEKSKKRNIITPAALNIYYRDIPVAAYHYKSLFPNNLLNTDELLKVDELLPKIEAFKALLETNPSERVLLNFINDNEAYFIIASLLKSNFRFGHHEAFAFREFPLGTNFVADYLLVGKNSGGYHFVFVELENPCGQICTKEGDWGQTIRKGIRQVNDWNSWLESNYTHLRPIFEKYLGSMLPLPREFSQLDKSRFHFVVIAGRRDDFTDKSYEAQRRLQRDSNILILHYDNLIDAAHYVLEAKNY